MGKNSFKKIEGKSYPKISFIIFGIGLVISLISLVSVVFPALISETVVPNAFDGLGVGTAPIDPYETGPLAGLLILSNAIVFGLYFFRKRIPQISKIFSFDIPKKISLVIVFVVIVTYGSIAFSEVHTDEIYEDWKTVKHVTESSDLSKITGMGPHLRFFLLDQSMILFGSYKIIPLFSSMVLLGITYLFTTSLTKNRFSGLVKEPRPGVRSGSIKNSYCLPFNELINKEDKTFLEKKFIKEKFAKLGIIEDNNLVFSCGSGITAAVLSLAYSIINDKYLPIVYDGSWAEYGKIKI